jgi:(2Fe-2S) ferredoxin
MHRLATLLTHAMPYRIYLCNGPHCTARGANGTRQALDIALWEAGMLDITEVQISGCQDHCDHGPNLLVHPGACRYVGVSPERAAAIVTSHLRDNRPIIEWQATPEMRRQPR